MSFKLFGLRGLFSMIEDHLTDLFSILLVKIVYLQLRIVTLDVQSVETFLFVPSGLFSLSNQLSQQVSPRGLTMTWSFLHKQRFRRLET